MTASVLLPKLMLLVLVKVKYCLVNCDIWLYQNFLYSGVVYFPVMALLKRVKRKTLQKEWRTISLIFAQLLLLVLIVVQALHILGLHINFSLRIFEIKPVFNPVEITVFVLSIILLAILSYAIMKRNPSLFKAEKSAPGIIKQAAKEKLRNAKNDPRAPALLLIDFMFVAAVVIAIYAYFDPELELIPWSKVGLMPPYTTIINAVIAIVILGAFYYMYRFTASYRNR